MGLGKLLLSNIWILAMSASSSLGQTPWFGVFIKNSGPNCPICGANCYTDTTAINAGCAVTATGKYLVLSNGVWVQGDGNNVLNVNGSDSWHYALNANGKGWSATLLSKNTANLGGRACPSSVYVDDTNKVASGRCLYYDSGNAPQYLNAAGNSQTNQAMMGLSSWNVSTTGNGTAMAWYEGNIKTCAAKGMRLPTLYESSAGDPVYYKPTDASPNFNAANGVPPASQGTSTWTSSARDVVTAGYWIWSASSVTYNSYFGSNAVRCVLP
jgi:hypothetical protein